jgi:uncharacterized membrane protein YphA (DoxX/SURF4 family)
MERLFLLVRKQAFFQWFIIHLRYLLGVAFIPSGLVKLMGERFTQISTDQPIGYFFEGLYQSGFYYNFLGFAQVFAALLLMSQRFATLGALMYAGLVTNIWLITLSLSFKGTWVITSLMMLAVLALSLWDSPKLRALYISGNKSIQIGAYPEASRFWQWLGLFYFTVLMGWYFLAANTSVSIVIVTVLVGAFLASQLLLRMKKVKLSDSI